MYGKPSRRRYCRLQSPPLPKRDVWVKFRPLDLASLLAEKGDRFPTDVSESMKMTSDFFRNRSVFSCFLFICLLFGGGDFPTRPSLACRFDGRGRAARNSKATPQMATAVASTNYQGARDAQTKGNRNRSDPFEVEIN